MSVDHPEQLEGLRLAGRLVAGTLRALREAVRPGVTTGELDTLAARIFAAHGARSGPILTYRYPRSICVSVGDEVVHAIPGPRRLRAGDIVTLDVAAELDGYHADAATTVPVGRAGALAERLIAAARAALAAGLEAAQPGAALRDVGAAIERATVARGFWVIPELTGHGVGRRMHEPPTVYNWPAPSADLVLEPGLVFTIEPMIAAGDPKVELGADGWTVRTADHGLSAHEEHTVMVAPGGPVVLTAGHDES
jgi:methionyl aminopeptidase